MESRFDHKTVEPQIYRRWERSGFFNPDKLPRTHKKPFTIIMPPPNANGPLHIGHAFEVAIQDLMIRYYRMKGRKTLWLPGADHAGFETQVVFDKKLEKEKRSRFQIPRDKLWQEIWQFTQDNKKVMEAQLRRLGATCDWSREKFTLDPDIIKKTQETFIQLYKDGLVYRGTRLVNWCIKHQTAFSDLEVKYIEKKDPLYYITYGPFVLATVRPETKFGDTAIAVNPKDKRYQKYIGKEIIAEDVLGPIKLKVIADEAVDPKFGTGVIKVTPAHDPTDFEIGLRHELEVRQVIDKFGRLNEKTGPYQGLKIREAREKVAEDLKKKGLLKKVDENYLHSIAVCYKCETPLEPLLLPQWFVKTKPLAKKAIEVVEKGKIQFVPARFKKIYLYWLKNIRDWNISRQIVWGIRIPAWYYDEKIYVGAKPPGGQDWKQDPDVFDTWFSSGQWPFLTLNYPRGRDYKKFYPTDVMAPGYEILFFWVARMIMLGLYRTKRVPFKTVYLHGMVRDKDRQKISKSKGNTIDPLGVAELYGVDAIRMALVVGTAPGNDPTISEDKIRGYRNFTTKIWNASRFVISNYDKKLKTKPKYTKADRGNLKKLKEVKKQITTDIEKFRFHHAAETLYHYFWHTFADKIIEQAKPRLSASASTFAKASADKKAMAGKAAAQTMLLEILKENLKMLHPFMPFVTEEIWSRLPRKPRNLLMIEKW